MYRNRGYLGSSPVIQAKTGFFNAVTGNNNFFTAFLHAGNFVIVRVRDVNGAQTITANNGLVLAGVGQGSNGNAWGGTVPTTGNYVFSYTAANNNAGVFQLVEVASTAATITNSGVPSGSSGSPITLTITPNSTPVLCVIFVDNGDINNQTDSLQFNLPVLSYAQGEFVIETLYLQAWVLVTTIKTGGTFTLNIIGGTSHAGVVITPICRQ